MEYAAYVEMDIRPQKYLYQVRALDVWVLCVAVWSVSLACQLFAGISSQVALLQDRADDGEAGSPDHHAVHAAAQ